MRWIESSLLVVAVVAALAEPAAAQANRTHMGVRIPDMVSLEWSESMCAFRRVFPDGTRSAGAWTIPVFKQLVVTDYSLRYIGAEPNDGDTMSVTVSAMRTPSVLSPIRHLQVPIGANGFGSLHVNETSGTVVGSGHLTLQSQGFGCAATAAEDCRGCWVKGYLVQTPLLLPPGLRP